MAYRGGKQLHKCTGHRPTFEGAQCKSQQHRSTSIPSQKVRVLQINTVFCYALLARLSMNTTETGTEIQKQNQKQQVKKKQLMTSEPLSCSVLNRHLHRAIQTQNYAESSVAINNSSPVVATKYHWHQHNKSQQKKASSSSYQTGAAILDNI